MDKPAEGLPEEPLEAYPLSPGYMTWVNYSRALRSLCQRLLNDRDFAKAIVDNKLKDEIERQQARIRELESAIRWALGEGDCDFEPRRPDDPPYWWRKNLRKLAFGSLIYNKDTRTIEAEAAERKDKP